MKTSSAHDRFGANSEVSFSSDAKLFADLERYTDPLWDWVLRESSASKNVSTEPTYMAGLLKGFVVAPSGKDPVACIGTR